ncbi:MAG: nucleotide sugar dehydrogenase [Alphaproteobacteria bacterium]
MTLNLQNCHAAVIGLGYVGMPLAVMLARHIKVTGFDIFEARIKSLQAGIDTNRELKSEDLKNTQCVFTGNADDLKGCDVFIITVPTPLDDRNNPDLAAVRAASKAVTPYLKKGSIVVYESTVYPGVTEDICGPILAEGSGLKCGVDFFLGYSPERINPGDAEHTVQKITKVVAGQTPEVTDFLAVLYGSMNGGNIFRARDIRTAEASKAIENAQRDINVAFINEITMVLSKLGLSTHDVLQAAGTKWNFLPFTPGLVGGHCIGVDPYYLAHCAQEVGHHPEIILAGRKINDEMGLFVADQIDTLLPRKGRVLILGFTFKENINDIRNTKVMDIVKRLQAQGHVVDIHDSHAESSEVKHEYGVELIGALPDKKIYDGVAVVVAHKEYRGLKAPDVQVFLKNEAFIYDFKNLWRGTDIGMLPGYRAL